MVTLDTPAQNIQTLSMLRRSGRSFIWRWIGKFIESCEISSRYQRFATCPARPWNFPDNETPNEQKKLSQASWNEESVKSKWMTSSERVKCNKNYHRSWRDVFMMRFHFVHRLDVKMRHLSDENIQKLIFFYFFLRQLWLLSSCEDPFDLQFTLKRTQSTRTQKSSSRYCRRLRRPWTPATAKFLAIWNRFPWTFPGVGENCFKGD